MNHLMLDLETLSTTPKSAVISLACVQFDPDKSTTGAQFCKTVDLESAMNGREISSSTLKFWMQQDKKLQEQTFSGSLLMPVVLNNLFKFVCDLKIKYDDIRVWANGSTFDVTIIEDLFRHYGMNAPWPFWAHRDCRTIEDAAYGLVRRREFSREGPTHHPLYDCLFQIEYVSAMWQALRRIK